MKKPIALLAACLALSCGSTVVTPGNTGSSTSGQGGATSASSSAGGMGGSLVTSSTSTTTSTFCSDPTLFLDIEGDGPLQHFDASCMPEGYLIWPGGPKPPGPPPEPMESLAINACTAQASYHLSFLGAPELWPATGTIIQGSYEQGGAMYLLTGTGTVDVTTFGFVGGVIEGSFSLTVSDGSMTPLTLAGKFRVCRTPDQIPV